MRTKNLLKEIVQKETIIDFTEHIETQFSSSCKSRQREIFNTLDFEQKNASVSFYKCTSCSGKYFWSGGLENSRTICIDCESDHLTKKDLLDKNALPVWLDEDGKIHEELPQCMEDLTFGEMLCIQKVAFLFPTSHLQYGRRGLSGNTVMFMKDLLSICTELPRSEVEVMTLIRNYTKNGEIKEQRFTIRKSKVLEVLKFLKEHHPSYKDIIINESNLDWIGENEIGSVLKCAEIEKCAGDENNEEKETVAEDQTEVNGELIESYGLAMNEAIDKYNPQSKNILEALKMQPKQANLEYPQVQDKPVDEYLYQNVFADAYPWLFPGGLGDISNLVHNNKTNALKWTRRLLHYFDGRFARDPSITFHLLNYLQRHINNRDSLYYIKDNYHTKDKTVDDLREQVANGDMSFVRNIQNWASYNIRGSDPWWRSRKHELDSWISYHLKEKNGPPTLFMTFSCAEFWWKDLKEFLIKRCENTIDHDKAMLLKNGSKDEQNRVKIELVDKYSYCVQQFFQLRMDNWLETIGKNVFQIKHYYLRFEFAKGRGQIHAHMLAITRDYHFIAKYYNEQKKDPFVGTRVYSEYARNRLSLTAEKPEYDSEQMKELESISSRFCETLDVSNDLNSLIEKCHIHNCNNYCLRTNKGSRKRQCRAGCGIENEVGSGITPGFPIQSMDSIDHDFKRQIKILKLKRNNERMTQTSTTMLQSWRANCDLSVIVYDTDPAKLCPQDIAKISGYIVSYCTKGNATYKKEQEAISKVIADYDDDLLCDDEKTAETHILKLSRRILNSFSSTRIISKAEASTELLSLDLYWCTESFSHVRLSKASKLQNSFGNDNFVNFDKIERYAQRHDKFEDLNLHDFISYCSETRRRKIMEIQSDEQLFRLRKTQNTLKKEILHGVGLNGHPHYPVTEGYAKSTLLMYKPWSRKAKLEFDTNPTLLFSEFFSFLSSKDCPLSVILSYLIAMENHERSEKCGHVEDNDVVYDGTGCYDKSLNEYLNALQSIQMKKNTLCECYRGYDGLYDFHKQFSKRDTFNQDIQWLYDRKAEYFEKEKTRPKKLNRNAKENRNYEISDVSNNFEQETVVFAIIEKLREWIEFPGKHELDPSLTFKPLLLTVRGEAGTGKSHVIKVVTNAVERIFDVKVTITCAPTGNAAFNVNGKTCHSFFGLDLEHGKKSTLSQTKQTQLKECLKRLLMVIIDERSLLSCETLAKIHSNCCNFAHGGINNHLPWGGIPIIVLVGDDKQLPAVMNYDRGGGVTTIFNTDGFENHQKKETKLHREGQRLFKQLSQRVISLKQNCRIDEENNFLKTCCKQLRNGPGLSKTNAKELLQYRFENPNLSNRRRDELIANAIWIFTTNREVDEHNVRMVEKMVNRENPLITSSYKISSRDGKRDYGNKSHFKREDRISGAISFCRGSRVSIDRNLWQEVGLYNGALGTVVDIRYKPRTSPLTGDFPAYVIVDMDFYTGPVWDRSNPTHIPIPIAERNCRKGCCVMRNIPLSVSFARTLHKFQGQQVGPKHSNKMMVFGPGSSAFEASNPGLLYVGLSRISTIGPTIHNSCFYFFGSDADENRLRNVTHKRGDKSRPTKVKYKRVVQREVWEKYLDINEENRPFQFSINQRESILHWAKWKKLSVQELDNIISYHSKKKTMPQRPQNLYI